mmetsp:Transcript_4012/g.8353  ORF Transcript_4012/g.8353 Transcript_4012/m.8353 type:complete len:229 (-) Transcript_4012:470-1156(-)
MLVVTCSPSLKLGEPEILPETDPSRVILHWFNVGTPLGAEATFFLGAALTGAFLGAAFLEAAVLANRLKEALCLGAALAGASLGAAVLANTLKEALCLGAALAGAFLGAAFFLGTALAGAFLAGGFSRSLTPSPKSENVDRGLAFSIALIAAFASVSFRSLVRVIVAPGLAPAKSLKAAMMLAFLTAVSELKKYRLLDFVPTTDPFSIFPFEIGEVSIKSPSSKFGEP